MPPFPAHCLEKVTWNCFIGACCSRTATGICVLAMITLINVNSVVSINTGCCIKTSSCLIENDKGYIEVGNVRIAHWICGSLTNRFHAAFVSSSCQYYRSLGEFETSDPENLYRVFQQVPYESYFVLVTSTISGIGSDLSQMLRNESEYIKVMDVFEDIGLDRKENGLPMNVLSNVEANVLNFEGYSYEEECKLTRMGLEYAGDLSGAGEDAEKPCQNWTQNSPNLHPYKPGARPGYSLVGNKCRNPNNDPNGPWCYLSEEEGWDYCHLPYCDNTNEALTYIVKKGYNSWSNRVVKLTNHDMLPRINIHEITANKEGCGRSLKSLDRTTLNPLIYGFDFQSTTVVAGINKLNLVSSEPLMCSENIIGWEYIPASTGHVYLTVMRHNAQDKTLLPLHTTDLYITDTMLMDENEVQYKCVRDDPVQHTTVGDLYGYYTDDHTSDLPAILVQVLPNQYTKMTYPCGQQFTWSGVETVIQFDKDKSSFEDQKQIIYSESKTMYMNLALKPIVQKAFVYTCGCTSDLECQLYGDMNMRCNQHHCACPNDYKFNRNANLCVSFKMGHVKAYQSSTFTNADFSGDAMNAVDNNVDSGLFTGTYSMTMPEVNPWWVLDVGSVSRVYAISIRTPKPIDGMAELWQSVEEYQAKRPSDVTLSNHHNSDIPNMGVQQVQVMITHGPYSWIITNENGDSSHMLNMEMEDGKHIYMSNENHFGPVGQSMTNIIKLEYIGYLQSVNDTMCIGTENNDLIVIPLHEERNCAHMTNHSSLRVYIYRDSHHREDSVFVISDMNGRQPNAADVRDQERLWLGQETPLLFKFYENEALRLEGTSTEVDWLLDENTGVYISPHSNHLLCLESNSQELILSSTCTTKFYLKHLFDHLPKYKYGSMSWAGNREPHYQTFTLENVNYKPCLEIVRPKYKPENLGIASFSKEDGGKIYATVTGENNEISEQGYTSPITMRHSPFGLHDFVVGVTEGFNRKDFISDHFMTCAVYKGGVTPGRELMLDCEDAPVIGRYVALYMNNDQDGETIMLTDVDVYSLKGVLDGGKLEKCEHIPDKCQQLCVESEGRAKCACFPGFQMSANNLTSCEDIDECQDDLGGCSHVCVNTEGSFYCDCFRGYHISQNQRNCVDRNECSFSNGLCSHLCYNQLGTHSCDCFEGYQLAGDRKTCVGMNKVQLEFSLNLEFKEELMQDTVEHRSLKQEVQNNLDNLCAHGIFVFFEPNKVTCIVEGPFKNLGVLIIGFIAVFEDHVTELQKALFTTKLKQAMEEMYKGGFIIGNDRQAIGDLTYINDKYQSGQHKSWLVQDECDLFKNTGYCGNGTCEVIDEKPECICEEHFFGARCDVHYKIIEKVDPRWARTGLLVITGLLVFSFPGILFLLCSNREDVV